MSGVRVETVRPERERPPRTAAARPGAPARVLRAAALASALVAVAVFHIWSRTRVLDAGYELGEQAKAHARLSSEHDRLRIEVETLRAPSRLEQYARTRLGMAPPAPGAVWVAGPRLASAAAGGAGGTGVDRRPAPAGPVVSTTSRSAAAGPSAAAGERVALRGPPRAGRAPPVREHD